MKSWMGDVMSTVDSANLCTQSNKPVHNNIIPSDDPRYLHGDLTCSCDRTQHLHNLLVIGHQCKLESRAASTVQRVGVAAQLGHQTAGGLPAASQSSEHQRSLVTDTRL